MTSTTTSPALPDLVGALAEDALALRLGTLAVRRLRLNKETTTATSR